LTQIHDLRRVGLAVSRETAPAVFAPAHLPRTFIGLYMQPSRGGLSWPTLPIALPRQLLIPHPPRILRARLPLARVQQLPRRFAQREGQTATLADVHLALRRVLALPAPVRVALVAVPVVLLAASAQAMADPAADVLGSVGGNMARATARTLLCPVRRRATLRQ
jgi:hypothetical protein